MSTALPKWLLVFWDVQEGRVEVHPSLRQEGGALGAYAVIGHVLWCAAPLLSASQRLRQEGEGTASR